MLSYIYKNIYICNGGIYNIFIYIAIVLKLSKALPMIRMHALRVCMVNNWLRVLPHQVDATSDVS